MTRAGVIALADAVATRAAWMSLHDRLIAENPTLTARQMLKEQNLARAAVESLCGHGATLETAMLAVGICTACLRTAQAITTDAPERLPEALAGVLDRLSGHS